LIFGEGIEIKRELGLPHDRHAPISGDKFRDEYQLARVEGEIQWDIVKAPRIPGQKAWRLRMA
jgi:hypothetical protein